MAVPAHRRHPPRAARAAILVAAGLVAGCAGSNIGQIFSSGLARPETIYVDDFNFASEPSAVDPDFVVRLKRKMNGLTDDAANSEAGARVTAVIGEAVIANLRSAGLPAVAGGSTTVKIGQIIALVSGQVRINADPKRKPGPFGTSETAADVTLTWVSSPEQKPVLKFVALAAPERNAAPAASGRAGGSGFFVADKGGAVDVKLSANVEAHARSLAREVAKRLIGFAVEQGWIKAPPG